MQTLQFELTGTRALLMHNERLANPLDPHARALKEVSGKRGKTEEDHLALAWAEFQGGIYHDDELGPYIPARMIEATMRESAKMSKRGKAVGRGIEVPEDRIKLLYDGPRDVLGLYEAGFKDQRTVGNQSNRVLRTRPIFRPWSLRFTMLFDPAIFSKNDVVFILKNAGEYMGIGDYRPRFGKFSVKEI